MAASPIARETIDFALKSLRLNETPAEDLPWGSFYDNDGWLESLPRSTQAFICAVEQVGDHPDRSLLYSHMAAQQLATWKNTKSTEDLDAAIAMYVVAIKYTRPDDAQRPDRLSALAFACQSRWEQTNNPGDLDVTVHFFRRTVIAAEPDNTALAAFLTNLACILKRRWELLKKPEDLQDAKLGFSRSIDLAAHHPLLPLMLSNFGDLIRLTTPAGDVLRLKSLTEAADLHERALKALQPSLPMPYSAIWRHAAISQHALFKITFNETSSSKAIEYYKRSIEMTLKSNPTYLSWHIELAEHLTLRYHRWKRLEDIEEAIHLYDRIITIDQRNFAAAIGIADILRMLADKNTDVTSRRRQLKEACQLADYSITLIDEESDSRGWAYFRASAIYSCYYEEDGDLCYLDTAVDLSKLSLQYTKHEAFWEFGRWCGEVCQSRHVETGSAGDLGQAFRAVRIAIESLDWRDTENLTPCLWVLGKCYACLSRRSGKTDDLKEALKWLETACVPFPGQEDTLALIQNDLANAYVSLHHQTFAPDCLDNAIQHYTYSIRNLTKSGMRSNHQNFAMLQTGIGQAMLERFQQWDSQDDLKSAVTSFRTCLSMTESRSPRHAGRACNLSCSLQLSFTLHKYGTLLKEAQSLLMNVLNSADSPANQVLRLAHCHMGNIYLYHYNNSGHLSDTDLAIEQYDQMKALSGEPGRFRAEAKINRSVALHKKAQNSAEIQDYTAAIAQFDDVVAMESTDALQILTARANKAETYRDMFETFGNTHDGIRALQEFNDLANMVDARTDLIIRAAEAASVLVVSLNSDYSAAYSHILKAMKLLPQAISLFSNRLEQLRLVRKYHYLPSSATALAIAAGTEPTHVLFRLEEARAFIWERFLLYDTPLDRLRQEHPWLAHEFEYLRSSLTSQKTLESGSIFHNVLPEKDQIRLERHASTNSYADLVKKIRKLEGFEDFLLASSSNENLTAEAHDSPVVLVNTSSYRCDAIIRSRKGITSLPLESLRMEDVTQQALQLYAAQFALSNDFMEACTRFEQVMLWLWQVIAKPILEALEHEDLMQTNIDKQRVFWVSSGWLSIFPIHAAGDWTSSRQSNTKPSVQERVISSYVPSLRVLDFMRRREQHLNAPDAPGKTLLVGMPTTPDMGPDSNLDADLEIAMIDSLIQESSPVESLLSPLPTFSDVTTSLPICELAHFACHGCADSDDPSKSAIRLADWVQKPLNVRTLLNMKLQRCHLVFLSACETAANKDLLLRDEGLHVAGAFNMAGVPHAVAGMWKIEDAASIALVKAFYEKLFEGKARERYKGTAVALHTAVESLRTRGFHPVLWGAFVHMGP